MAARPRNHDRPRPRSGSFSRAHRGRGYPEAKSGDTLDVDSLDYQGTHAKHSKHWIGSSHLRCKFTGYGAPNRESHLALGGSMLVFTGNPGTLSNGTGIYQGATGRVISMKEVADDATDFVAWIQLRG